MNKLVTVAVIAIGLSVFGAEPGNQVNWKNTVSDGSYSLGTNWEGDAAPLAAGQTATFALGEATGAYTATIPAAGLAECAMTYLKTIGSTASLVLNATGTTWTKGAGAYAAADEAFRVTDTDGKTILNLSNVDTMGATDVFTLTDGKLSYDGATKTFSVDGTWNLGSTTIGLGSVAAAQVVFNAGSAVTGKVVNVNGTTPLVINGGTHKFTGTTSIGAASWANSKMRILGGTSKFTGDTYICGPNTGHSKGELEIGGTASVVLGIVRMSDGYSANGQVSRIRTTGTGEVSFTGQCQTRVTNGGSAAEFIAEGSSTLNMPSSTDYLTNGKMDCALRIMATNQATMVLNALPSYYINKATVASCYVRFLDHATVVIPSGKTISFGSHCENGTVYTNCFQAAEDATVLVKGAMSLCGGYNGMYGYFPLKDRARLVVTSTGSLTIGGANSADSGLFVRDNATVLSSNNVSVARAHGFIDMEGGSMTVKGFSLSGTASATRPALAAQGSTIRPIMDNASFLAGFTQATLSGAGLVFDTDGYSVGISQAFTGTTFAKVGAGTMSVGTASTHDTTVVAGGTLALASGVNTFGNALVVTNDAVVSTVGDSTGLTLSALTLGDATTAGTVMIDNADVITLPNDAALTVNAGKIVLSDPLTIGDVGFLKVTSGTISAAKLEKLTLVNSSITREYEFNVVPDGDGAKIVLTIAEVTTHEQTWTGATDASWETAANWTPAKKPTSSSALTFPSGAARKDIAVASAAQAQSFVVDGEYSFGGAGSLLLPNLELKDGASATFDLPVEVPTGLAPVTPDGAALAFNGALACPALYGITFAGARSFRIAGDNADFLGGWDFNAVTGRVTFAGEHAAGVATKNETLQLGPGTITTEGADEIVVNQTTTFAPGATTSASILDTDAPTTFANGLTVSSGAFVKTGTNTLKVVYPSGTYYLGRVAPDTSVADRQGYVKIDLPENGSGAFGGAGLSEYNVLEGTLELTPQAGLLSNPTVNGGSKHAAIGGNYSNTVESVLWVHGAITMTGGANSQYWTVGCFTPEGAAAHPTLRVTDGASFTPNELALGANNYWGYLSGKNRTSPYYPTLAVTNATVQPSGTLYFGPARWYPSDVIHPTIRLGANGKANSNSILAFGVNVDGLVDGGSIYTGSSFQFGCSGTQGAKNYSGEMKFFNGGSISVTKFLSNFALDDKKRQARFRFDNGKLTLRSTDTSAVSDPTNVMFVAEQGGMTIAVGSGVTHTFALQLAGSGAVTKTGAGALVLTNRASAAVLDSTIKGYTGAFTVAEGTVDFGGQDISHFASLGGAGTVKNAAGNTLTVTAAEGAVPTIDGMTLNRLKVDFAAYGVSLKKGDVVTVAKLANGATVGRFKAVNVGDGLSATFEVDGDGNVVATVCNKNGFVVTIK